MRRFKKAILFTVVFFSTISVPCFSLEILHLGSDLERGDGWEMRSTVVGLFYNVSPYDSLTISNLSLLPQYRYHSQELKPDTIIYKIGRRFKVIDFDSVFISQYIPTWPEQAGFAEYILNDIKNGDCYNLKDLSIEKLNHLIEIQGSNIILDNYMKYSSLALVLQHFDFDMVLVENGLELARANSIMWDDLNSDEQFLMAKQLKDKISAPQIDSTDNNYRVNFYVYCPPAMAVDMIESSFQNNKLISIKISDIIDHKEMQKQIDKVKRKIKK